MTSTYLQISDFNRAKCAKRPNEEIPLNEKRDKLFVKRHFCSKITRHIISGVVPLIYKLKKTHERFAITRITHTLVVIRRILKRDYNHIDHSKLDHLFRLYN